MADTHKRLHAIIHGRVQGVSFRHHTTLKAQELNVTGWVYNRPDGKVEVVAEGTDEQLQALLDFLHKGSPHAQVKQVDPNWQGASGEFDTFRTRYDKP